ncbi:hypothetical protein R1flu_018823 [Riccia fluitans]|uniref:Reverse transcriptase domain-containing protein n=1 Tax=Riccia fluitans TaxID=41844 RepID=A0ABD1ZHA0_9MARC
MHGDCETIIHALRATLDLHLNWVVLQVDIWNAFNIVSRKGFEYLALLLDQIPFRHHFLLYERSSLPFWVELYRVLKSPWTREDMIEQLRRCRNAPRPLNN